MVMHKKFLKNGQIWTLTHVKHVSRNVARVTLKGKRAGRKNGCRLPLKMKYIVKNLTVFKFKSLFHVKSLTVPGPIPLNTVEWDNDGNIECCHFVDSYYQKQEKIWMKKHLKIDIDLYYSNYL